MNEGSAHEGITKVMPVLEGDGLCAGDYDLMIAKDILNSSVGGVSYKILRISLINKTTWADILKALPKGSIINSYKRVR